MLLLNACQAIANETLGENIDARIITTTVKAKLAAEKNSPLMRDQVDTNRGVVQLSGVVASGADRSRAERKWHQICRQQSAGAVRSLD